MEVLCLASSSQPLQNLVEEIKQNENLGDETRWSMVYKAGTRLYRNFPEKSTKIFEELANTASGSANLAAHLTLGNLAYRIDKNVEKAVFHYSHARKMLPLTSPLNELPTYRLGRLYLVQGHGLKGMETLVKFARRFPRSRYLGKAYMALGDACVALNSPEKAATYYRRVMRVSHRMAEEAGEKLAKLQDMPTSQQWLETRAQQIRSISVDDIAIKDENDDKLDEASEAENQPIIQADKNKPVEIEDFEPEALYEMIQEQGMSAKPDVVRTGDLAHEILRRKEVEPLLREKTVRHYISSRFFRRLNPEQINEEIEKLLATHNYADWQSELLFRMAQVRDYFLKDYEEANRAYFEYLSFFPDGKRAVEVRERIPRVFVNAKDTKNAFRFYEKLIEDNSIAEDIRVKASMDVARLHIIEEQKSEAIKSLEAALAYKTDMRPEICLRLEKLTEDFSYVRRAIDYEGNEEFRLKALKRLVAKAEEDENYGQAAGLLNDFSDTFSSIDAEIFVEKKVDELGKRGVIGEIERMIDFYPEEPETASRMFKLAKLVEGAENTRYRSQDLFYEITLVYPDSEFYQESRIRTENVRTIKAVAELTDMFKRGIKGDIGEEVLIERARLLKANLKDLSGAMENYQSFVQLFPNSNKLDEVYLAMGDIVLAQKGSSREALQYYEKGLAQSRDPFVREDLTARINKLQKFQSLVIYSESEEQVEEGINQVYRVWRLERNHTYALGLLENAISELHNRPLVARLRYLCGRIHEDNGRLDAAVNEYEKALSSLYHPGCRKDMLLYRMARIKMAQKQLESAAAYYRALVHRYPKSLLSRSGLYQLYKFELKNKNLTRAHHYLDRLLMFKALFPTHREELAAKLKEVEARMNVEEMKRLSRYSNIGGGELSYFIGKVLEYDLRDYDKAIEQYEEFLKTNPSIRRSREIMTKIADLYEKKGDYVKTVGYLDMLLDTYEPSVTNFDLILRIGSLVEDKLMKPELVNLFYGSIAADYRDVRKVREFALAKLRRLEEQKIEAAKPRKKKIVKRVYSEDDEWVLEEMEDIIERQVEDLQDFKKAERQLEDLWDENPDSLATLDIMKTLVKLNNEQLVDPQKAAMYYEKWLEVNSHDPMYKEITLELYEHYMEILQDGNKALRLLENFVRDNPVSIDTLDIELKLGKANEIRIRNFEEARRIYQRIIDTKQNEPVVHEAYFRMGFVMREGFANYDEAIKHWQELIDLFYNNEFADRAQFAIGYTYEAYQRNFTQARQAYEKILNLYPNSSLQNEARDALLRIEGK
jgi:tetratricopeptide (TPR) repeat protein